MLEMFERHFFLVLSHPQGIMECIYSDTTYTIHEFVEENASQSLSKLNIHYAQ